MRCYKCKYLRGELHSAFPGPLFTSYRITFYNSIELSCLHYTGELVVAEQKPFQYSVNVALANLKKHPSTVKVKSLRPNLDVCNST